MLVSLATLAIAIPIPLGLYIYMALGPKRVCVEYSEKYQDRDPGRTKDYEELVDDTKGFAEERLQWHQRRR